MRRSITTEAIIGLGPIVMVFFFPRPSLTTTYYFKFRVILKSWPKVLKVCLLSNSCWVISSKIEKLPIILVILITMVDPIKSIGLIVLVNWFLVSKLKFLMWLVLIIICILALGRSLGGSLCSKSLIVFSNEHWDFAFSYQSSKLKFLKGYFSLNTTFSSI